MLLSFKVNRKFVHETALKLSGDALRFYLRISWEAKYPRRRVRQPNPILDKGKHNRGLWIDDQEISEWLGITVHQVNKIRYELIDHNLITYDTPTGIKLDRSLIGYYTIRRMY